MELKRVAILLLLVLISAWPVSGKVIYVDDDATRANDGTSWANAHVYLQDGLSDANDSQKPVEIRVAQGIYKPDQGKDQAPGDQEATFQLVNGVSLKGGYAGFGRLDPNARDIHLYETLLSGDIRGNDVDISDPCCLPREPSRMDNNYHVVTGSSTDETAVLDGFTITGGCATESGGGGMCNIKGSPSVKSCTFLKNSAYGYESHAQGGGIYNEYGSPTLVECMFIMNAVDVGIPDHGSGNGGAIANTHSSPKIINCTFVRNVAMGNCGGAIFNSSSNPLLRNCKFIENIVFGGNNHSAGGATYNIDSHPTLTGCLFRNNVATGYDSEYDGGAISNVNSNPTLTDCSFIENLADWGGAISNSNGSPTITRCTFAGNRVNDNGGAICTGGGRPTLADCTFRDNRAYTFGGAICSSASSYLVVTDSTFTSNYAADGGAIYSNFRDNITLRDCTFSANSASRGGAICTNGAWYDDPNSATLIAHCTISGNSAYEGAGLYSGSNRRLLVVNCTLTGNHAAQSGGGFYCYGSQPSVSNCTFAQNLAKKGTSLACEWEPSIVQLTNSILWDGGNEVLDSAGSTIDAAFCDVESGYAGTGNLNTDPCFANPGHWDPNGTADDPNDDLWVDGDYHLKSQAGRWNPISQSWVQDALTSPCIDTGDPMSPIGYEPFPNGGRINMGAYGGTAEASKSYFGKPLCETIVAGDINGDCRVDLADFAIMALHWLRGHNP